LKKRGYHEVFSALEADLIIVNTCSVTSTADQKSRQHIRKMRRLAPKAILSPSWAAIASSMAQETLAMGADIVLGTSKRSELLGMSNVSKATIRRSST
jgi:threonylcarbamoyladenosine tRNA methylthiotransferase MtaB